MLKHFESGDPALESAFGGGPILVGDAERLCWLAKY